uniref:Serpin domain-containing protein n=1 Tax=Panagrolaimus davidi TaxID=227884 RepID=A0A914Q2L0_9BILA
MKKEPVESVCATIPTFHIETDLNLENILKELNITQIFRNGHGIKQMSEKTLIIGKAIHKAGIKIDQYGTCGYAAGEFGAEFQCFMEPTIFIADRPFIFFVTLVTEENPSNLKSILLMGTLC